MIRIAQFGRLISRQLHQQYHQCDHSRLCRKTSIGAVQRVIWQLVIAAAGLWRSLQCGIAGDHI